MPSIAHRLTRLFLRDADLENISYRLRLYFRLAKLFLGAGFLVRVTKYMLDWDLFFSSQFGLLSFSNWLSFLGARGPQLLLSTIILSVSFLFQRNTQAELEIMASMFSPTNTPQRWRMVEGQRTLPWLIVGWVSLSYILLLCVDYPKAFAAIIMCYALLNMIGLDMYRRNIYGCLDDVKYDPPAVDVHRDFVLQRREIEVAYLERHHHLKEVLVFVGAGCALLAAEPSNVSRFVPTSAPVFILAFVLVSNECLVGYWRSIRDRGIRRVNDHQMAADVERMGG